MNCDKLRHIQVLSERRQQASSSTSVRELIMADVYSADNRVLDEGWVREFCSSVWDEQNILIQRPVVGGMINDSEKGLGS